MYSKHGNVDIEIIEIFTDADWACSLTDRRSTTGYCALVGGNLVSWKSKKQSVVALSSSEAEYRAMAHGTCELLWLKTLLQELGFECKKPMFLHCDNNSACHIATNPVYHERTKHIEVDCHFIREKVTRQEVVLMPTHTADQLADFLTKSVTKKQLTSVFSKLGIVDIYSPA